MVYAVIFFILTTLVLGWTSYNLFQKNMELMKHLDKSIKLEDDVEKFYQVIMKLLVQTYAELERVDKRGTYSSDDEVGFAFKVIYTAIESCKKAVEDMKT